MVLIFRAIVALITSFVRSCAVLFRLQRVKQTKASRRIGPQAAAAETRARHRPSAALRDQLVAEIEQERLNGEPFRLPTTLDPKEPTGLRSSRVGELEAGPP
jgi:hypothetical protein